MLSVWDNRNSGMEGRLSLIQYLPAHRSTVTATCAAWLKSSRILLSVGKDRQLCFWKLGENRCFELFASHPKSHARVIWSCCPVFTHSVMMDDKKEMVVFATASRDGTVGVWGLSEDASVKV